MPDLTRFDFHAFRFMYSEDVRSMSACEVGQYILLMCEAWLSGKDASLPDDLKILALWARCEQVSDKVLAKFPVVDTEIGPRRRNARLYSEWCKVLERQEVASENGKKGGSSTSVYKSDAARENGKLGGRPKNPTETQALTQTQTNPNQAVPNQTKTFEHYFKNLAVRYRKSFHVNLSHGAMQKQEYANACAKFGEDVVLEKFESWAPDNMWIQERRHTNGLRQFYEALPSMVEADASTAWETEQTKIDLTLAARASEEGNRLAIAERDEHLRKIAEEEKLAENFTI